LAAVWEGRGEMRKKKEKQRKRVSAGYIIIFSDGIIDGRIPSVKAPRHYTAISV